MRIGIEAQRLFRKKKHGMDIVTLELIRNLQRIDKTNQYFVFVKPDEDDQILTESDNLKIVRLPGGAYPFWEQWALPRAAKKYGCQLLHCTSNTAPVFGDIPLITTLHDIIFMESPVLKILKSGGSAYQKFGNLYRKLVTPFVMKRSRKIITVSDYEKKRINEFFHNTDEEKVVGIHNGVSTHFTKITSAEDKQRVKQKYNLPDQFFFFMGNTHPKKNTNGVLKAFSDFKKRTENKVKLVMIDYPQETLTGLLEELNDLNLRNDIILTGYIDNRDLPAIYSQCELFLYPSLRESFGIPILEAMACGAPVISSNTSSMPEIAGKAAMLVDPYSVSEIASAMELLHKDTDLRKKLSTEGIEQAKLFSWEKMAEQVLQQYTQVKQA